MMYQYEQQQQADFAELDRKCADIFNRREEKRRQDCKVARKLRKAELRNAKANQLQCPGLHQHLVQPNRKRKPRQNAQDSLPSKHTEYIGHIQYLLGWLDTGDSGWTFGCYHNIDRSLVHLRYASDRFEQVHEAISRMCSRDERPFPNQWDSEFELIWHHASYQMDKLDDLNKLNHNNSHEIDRHLDKHEGEATPVQKFRIRKKKKCPTIRYSGEKRYNLSYQASQLLAAQFKISEKLTKADKERLKAATGLSDNILTNWFKNRRSRQRNLQSRVAQADSDSQSSSGCGGRNRYISTGSLDSQQSSSASVASPVYSDNISPLGFDAFPIDIGVDLMDDIDVGILSDVMLTPIELHGHEDYTFSLL